MLRIERKFKYFLLNFISKFLSPKKITFDKIPFREVKNILVVGQDRYGDCILGTPALRALKLLTPDSKIIYLAHGKYADVIFNNPDISEILVFNKKNSKKDWFKFILNLKRKRIDLAITLCTHPTKLTNAFLSYISGAKIRVGYNSTYIKTDEINEEGISKLFFNYIVERPDTAKHEIEWNFKLIESLGFKDDCFDKRPIICLTSEEEETTKNIINKIKKSRESKLIGIHPLVPEGSSWKLNNYIELINKIYTINTCEVILFWWKDELKNIKNIINETDNKPIISPETKTIRDLAGLISRLDIFIGKDTSSSHIASVFSIPSIIFFDNSVNVNQWRPWGNSNKLYTSETKFNTNDVFDTMKRFLVNC